MTRDQTATTTGGWLAALFAVAVWGASFVAIRVALEGFTPVGLVAGRLVLGTALLASLLRVAGRRVLPRPADRRRCLVLGLVLGLHMLLQAHGLQHTSAVNTGWIIAAIPVVIALLGRVVLGQVLRPLAWLGVGVASLGVLTVTSSSPADLARARFGDLLQLVSCLTWAVYTLAAGRVVASSGAGAVTSASMGVAALVCLAALPLGGLTHGSLDGRAWGAFAFLVVACSAAAYLCWYHALARLGPYRVGATLYAEPFFTLATAAWWLDERAGPAVLVGGLAVLAGVWCVQRGAPRPAA